MKKTAMIAKQAEKYDSFYLYDENRIITSVNTLKENFPQVQFLYSIKCNPNRHLLHSIFAQGFGADAASFGEVLLANEAGLKMPEATLLHCRPCNSQHKKNQQRYF